MVMTEADNRHMRTDTMKSIAAGSRKRTSLRIGCGFVLLAGLLDMTIALRAQAPAGINPPAKSDRQNAGTNDPKASGQRGAPPGAADPQNAKDEKEGGAAGGQSGSGRSDSNADANDQG